MIKLMQLLSELNINKPVRTWDFSKYIPNFDPYKMKVGDKIINYTNMFPVLYFVEFEQPNQRHHEVWFLLSRLENDLIHPIKQGVTVSIENLVKANNENKYLNELQISQPTINIDGQYGDITIITNGPLAGKEVELLMTDEGDEYKLIFSDMNKDHIGLDLHDYAIFTRWLKAQRIKFTAKAWEIGSYLEPDDMSDDSIDGIDVFIPEQYIKFLY
jgi:hypothetical protein